MRKFILCLSVPFLLLSSADAAPNGAQKIMRCFQQASAKLDPVSRDEKRETCLRSQMSQISLDRCFQFARGFEYSTSTEEMRLACVLAQNRLTARECARVAPQIEDASNREDVLWECVQRLNLTITSRECHKLAQLMVYPVQQVRAASYCQSEIASARGR